MAIDATSGVGMTPSGGATPIAGFVGFGVGEIEKPKPSVSTFAGYNGPDIGAILAGQKKLI